MLIDIFKKGVTDRSVILRIIDSADGTPETGVVFNTAGIDLWYRREGAAKVSITEASLSALTDAHSDGGFLHVGDGYYRLDVPDAAFASAANYVDFGGVVTGMVVIGGRVKLVDIDLEVTNIPANIIQAAGVAWGSSSITAAALAADAAAEIATQVRSELTTELARIDVAVSTRASQATLDTLDDFVDTEVAAILAAVDTEVASILDQTGTTGVVISTATQNSIRDAIFARAFSAAYSSLTFDELIKLFSSVLLGKASGLATTTATYRNLADNANVIVATVDVDGNRTAVTRTP